MALAFSRLIDNSVVVIPAGVTGVLLILFLTGTTLNIMSLMGLIMMVGIHPLGDRRGFCGSYKHRIGLELESDANGAIVRL